jgi:hypothetical protein
MPASESESGRDKTEVVDERNKRRSERVVLRIPVHLSAVMPGGKRISIEAQTLLVNAHGGLLDIGIEMITGQQIRLSNWSTEIVATAKVLRVEGSEEGRFSVAFEFESPTPHFWPLTSPPRDWSVVPSKVRILWLLGALIKALPLGFQKLIYFFHEFDQLLVVFLVGSLLQSSRHRSFLPFSME